MDALRPRELNTLLLIAGVAAVVVLVYADTFVSMAGIWTFTSYSHGMLVFPISAYLLWRLRGPLADAELRPWPWGIAVVAALVLLWLLSRAIGVQVGEHLAAVLLIPATVATCLGLALARRTLFPLLFLVAGVPIGDALIPTLMDFTADVSAALLRGVGVPVFRDGQFLSLPGGEFEVADVCSGMRTLIAGTMIALLFGYLNYRSRWKRAALVAATALALIVVNGIRAFIVMWVASATDMQVFAGNDHVYFGWVLFGVVMGALLWYGLKYAEEPGGGFAAPAEPGAVHGATVWPTVLVFGLVMLAITAQPFREDPSGVWWLLPGGALLLWLLSRFILPAQSGAERGAPAAGNAYRSARGALVVAAAAALLIGGPAAIRRDGPSGARASRMLILPEVAGCTSPGAWTGSWRPQWSSPDFVVAGSYRCAGQPVDVFVAGYVDDAQGKELVGVTNRPTPEAWRRFMKQGTRGIGGGIDVNEVLVDGAIRRSLIWYWYAVGDRTVTSTVGVKLLQALEVVRGGSSGGAIYWLETPLEPQPDGSRERLEPVARALEASFGAGAVSREPQ